MAARRGQPPRRARRRARQPPFHRGVRLGRVEVVDEIAQEEDATGTEGRRDARGRRSANSAASGSAIRRL